MRKVITYGTFDLFHRGHYNILKRAKEEGDYLVVGVTGESYDTERGKLSVQDSLATRIENVKKTGFADMIIVEEYLGQKIQDIIKYDIDVLVIGSDWKGKFDHLRKYCEVRYLERTKNISSTQIREEEMLNYKFGIVTDDLYDGETVIEPKYVSGIHVESVFSDDAQVAEEFCEKYELDSGYDDYDKFLNSVDIVYIKAGREKRYGYIKEALINKKHVICDAPYVLEEEKELELEKIAAENGVVLFSNISTLYLQAFGQLLWNARGNLIGDLISIKCGISKETFDSEKKMDFVDLAIYPVCVLIKMLGTKYEKFSCEIIKDEKGEPSYGMLTLFYDQAIAAAEIAFSDNIELSSAMEIIGTDGTIVVPHEWWRVGYFKVKGKNDKDFKRYSFNFEGNGFRYLIQDLLSLVRTGRIQSQRLQEDEMSTMIKLMAELKKHA